MGSFGAGPGSGKRRVQLRRLDDVRIRSCEERNEAWRNVASRSRGSGGREGHFRAKHGGTILGSLFNYVVGSRILASYVGVSYKTSVGFMVGKYVCPNAGREVHCKMTGEQERVCRSTNRTPLTQLVVSLGVPRRLAGVAMLVPCTK